MRAHRPEPHTLAGAYALNALTRADRTRFDRHLARCPQCAQEIRGLHEATARLAAAAAQQPPAGLTERALAAAAQTRQLPPLTRDTPLSWWARRRAAAGQAAGGRGSTPGRALIPRMSFALAGAGVVLAGILGLAARDAQHQLVEDQQHASVIAAVLTARDAAMISAHVRTGGTATVVMSAREHALVFAATGLPALPASRCYELWLMGPAGDKPAGMLPEPQHGMTGPVLASGLKPGERLGLTIEPAGGTPHPTTAAILLLPL
jgi:anti-sigma-K factor RskA